MMNSVIKKKFKRIRPKQGDVLQIDLDDGAHAYAHISNIDPLVVFYDWKGDEDLLLEEIVRLPIAFRIWVFNDVIRSGRWPRVGNVQSEELSVDPYFFKQDKISGTLAVHHRSFADTNYERPATLSEVKGLECAAVWDWGDVEDRLRDHFDKKSRDWMRELAINISKVPEHQRK